MKNIFLAIFSLVLFLECGSLSFAQTKANLETFSGTISEINLEKREIKIVTSQGKSLSVNTQNIKDVQRIEAGETDLKKSNVSPFDQISANDKVIIRGTLSTDNSTITARQIILIKQEDIKKKEAQNIEQWNKYGVSGTITGIDSAQKKISIQTRNQAQPTDVFITDSTDIQRYKRNASSLRDFEPGKFEEFKEGEQIRFLGNKSADGLKTEAKEIFVGAFNTRLGKVVSVDPQKNEIQMTDSLNKNVLVILNPESNMKRLTQESAQTVSSTQSNGKINLTSLMEKSPKISISDIKVGDEIAVASSSDKEAEKIFGLIVVSGMNVLKSQSSQKSSAPKKTFNLDVF